MAVQSISSWSYYCGANAVVKLGGITIGEAIAIRYALMQNRTPLYGYNAPLFNAVADGQVLVQGTLAVNYITHEYLLAAIKSQVDPRTADLFTRTTRTLDEEEALAFSETEVTNMLLDQDPNKKIEALKKQFWGTTKSSYSDYNLNIQSSGVWGRPDQNTKSVDITVEYGDTLKSSSTKHILKNVFFLGRSMDTSITEDPCVESFDFIARNIL